MVDKVSVEISVEEKAALRALTSLTKELKNLGDDGSKAVKKTDKAMDSFRGNLAAIATSGAIKAIAGGLKDLVVGSLETAAAFEKIQTQLEVLTGSQEKAAGLFKELKEFAGSTPFQLQGLAEASAQLISFGFDANSVTDRIKDIGEVAAGSGSSLKEVALIYGQVGAAGKLTGERLLQLQERAVPIGAALAETLGVAETEVKDLVSSGVVGFAEFEKAFKSLSKEGGLFEGAIDKQSQTISGVLSTLQDNFSLLQAELGNAFAPVFVENAKRLIFVFQDLTTSVIQNKDAVSSGISFIADYISTYAELASIVLKAKTPLSEINEQILETNESLDEMIGIRDREGALATLTGFLRPRFLELELLERIKVKEDELTGLIEKRKSILNVSSDDGRQEELRLAQEAFEAEQSRNAARVEKEAIVSSQILNERLKLAEALALLEEDKKIKAQETTLIDLTLEEEARAAAIASIETFEQNKADIVLKAELAKNQKIRDVQAKGLADKAAIAKQELAIIDSQNKAKAAQAENEALVEKARLTVAQNFLSAGISLSKKNSREQRALQTVQAIVSTYAAANNALSQFPYPFNIAAAASNVAIGLANVSKINGASFQNGGVFGGFQGATNGTDNATANVRTGEMILNANQQKTLFEIANNREAERDRSQVIEVTSVVQIDEREIARAVRNQKIEGFAA